MAKYYATQPTRETKLFSDVPARGNGYFTIPQSITVQFSKLFSLHVETLITTSGRSGPGFHQGLHSHTGATVMLFTGDNTGRVHRESNGICQRCTMADLNGQMAPFQHIQLYMLFFILKYLCLESYRLFS